MKQVLVMAKIGRPIKFVIRLTPEERTRLEGMIHCGIGALNSALKARILLKTDVSENGPGWSDERIAEALETSLSTVLRTRRQFVEEGLDCQSAFNGDPLSASKYDPPPGGWDRWGGVRDPLLLSEVETTAQPDLFYADHPRLPFHRCTTKRSFCNQTRWVKLDADFPPSGSSLQAFPHAGHREVSGEASVAACTASLVTGLTGESPVGVILSLTP